MAQLGQRHWDQTWFYPPMMGIGHREATDTDIIAMPVFYIV
jgi:hypothetical protein